MRWWGFYLYGGNDIRSAGAGFYCQEWAVSDWVLVLLLSLPPAIFAIWKTRQRYDAGFCRRCGYDLRATPDRCPECGTPVGRAEQRSEMSF
jgi:hypothetical protein